MTNTNTNTSEPTIKWEINGPDRIMPVKVIKKTDKTLWIESKDHRGTGFRFINQRRKINDFYDTWEAAHNELMKRANQDVERQKQELNRAQSVLGEIEKMKPPAQPPVAPGNLD